MNTCNVSDTYIVGMFWHGRECNGKVICSIY